MNKNQINRNKLMVFLKDLQQSNLFFQKFGGFFIFFHISGDFIQTFFFTIIYQETHSVFSYIFKRGKYTEVVNVCQ